MSQGTEDETTVNDSYSVTVLASIREQADIESGDEIRWSVDDDETVSIGIVKQRVGAFDEFKTASMCGDGATAHDRTGTERYMPRALLDATVVTAYADTDDDHAAGRETVRGVDHGDLPTGVITNDALR
jgi:bifunctional DNA-binding transcriptional regulator/antitoxin component of YhaV-PrlF toxin-antitoxin module